MNGIIELSNFLRILRVLCRKELCFLCSLIQTSDFFHIISVSSIMRTTSYLAILTASKKKQVWFAPHLCFKTLVFFKYLNYNWFLYIVIIIDITFGSRIVNSSFILIYLYHFIGDKIVPWWGKWNVLQPWKIFLGVVGVWPGCHYTNLYAETYIS